MAAAAERPHSYTIEPGDKVTSVMIYTLNLLILGEVVTREAIRVSTWLRSTASPKYIYVHDVQVLTFGGGSAPKPQAFKAILLPTRLVAGFHIKPPAQDPLDYEATEANRKMEPTTALVGTFRFEGTIRMSIQTSLDKYLDVAKEAYTGMYDIEIKNPTLPGMGVIRVPYAMLHNEQVLYSPR